MISMVQIKTKDNVHFEEPLNEQINVKLTIAEKNQIVTIAKQNYISIAELVRNVLRENIADYAMSVELKRNLFISNEIDTVLLEKRLISNRNESNLSKIREILTDFEAFCETHPKRIDIVAFKTRSSTLDYLMNIVYNNDIHLSEQIDTQYKRICKTKTYKALYEF